MSMNRLQKEAVFHDNRFGGNDDDRKIVNKYYSITINATNQFKKLIFQICKGKKLLEYGCGTGNSSLEWINHGALLTGIDISSEGIKKAKAKSKKYGYKAEFYVMNAEKTNFNSSCFDVVVGTGILHHLNLNNAYAELSRILNSDGSAIFIEPLGHNPFINIYRKLTPSIRTEFEHPLIKRDIQLAKQYFYKVEVYYYNLFTLFSIPFRNSSFFSTILNFLQLIDTLVFKVPFIKKYAWMVVLCISKPIK